MMANDELRALAEAARDGSGRHNQFDKYLAAFHPERIIELLDASRELARLRRNDLAVADTLSTKLQETNSALVEALAENERLRALLRKRVGLWADAAPEEAK